MKYGYQLEMGLIYMYIIKSLCVQSILIGYNGRVSGILDFHLLFNKKHWIKK